MPKKTRRTTPANPNITSQTSAGILIGTALVAALAGAGLSHALSPGKAAKQAALNPAESKPAPVPGTPSVVSVPLPETKDESAPPPMPSPEIVLGLPADKVALNLGNWSYDHKNYTAAAAYYQQAINRGIDNADVRTDLGNAIRFSGDPAAALKQYQIAHAKAPSHENSLFNQGGCYLQLGNTKSAIAVWQQYVKEFPNGEHTAVAHDLITQSSGLSSPAPK